MGSSRSLAGGMAALLCACSEAGPKSAADPDAGDELRLGRVHVVLQPGAPLEVSARFAVVRGLDEEFARARADIQFLPEEILNPGQCATDAALWPPTLARRSASGLRDDADLSLIDAGPLRLRLGATTLDIPLALVPDLLPYMSGVEYAYLGDPGPTPTPRAAPPTELTVTAGGGAEGLSAFAVSSTLPNPLERADMPLDVAWLDGGVGVIRWSGGTPDARDDLALRFAPTVDGTPTGDELYCVVPDTGHAHLDLSPLRAPGVLGRADSMVISAHRTRSVLFDAGEFIGSELLLERRASTTAPLLEPREVQLGAATGDALFAPG